MVIKRFHQLLLIATFVPVCWVLLQAVHELGHVAAAYATGGTVSKVVLHPLAISRTDTSGSSQTALVLWGGPAMGVGLPLVLFWIWKAASLGWDYLVQFFAGTCLVANGAYIAVGWYRGIGDAGDLVREGSPPWLLCLLGASAVVGGLGLWNGLGPNFGLGAAKGKVSYPAAWLSTALLLAVVGLELALISSQ